MNYRIDNESFQYAPKLYGLSERAEMGLSLDFFQREGDKTWSIDLDFNKEETKRIYLKLKQIFESSAK